VAIFDARGHEVRVLHAGPLTAGRHVLSWDVRGREGRRVAPGIYLVRAEQAGTAAVVRKVAIVR
jgi:hypothetical protein